MFPTSVGFHLPGQGGVLRAVLDHHVDEPDGRRGARGPRPGRDGVDPDAEPAARLVGEGAGVGLEGGLGGGHAAAVAGDDPLAGHVGERQERAALAHQRAEVPDEGDVAVGADAHGGQVAVARGVEQRVLDLGPVGQRVHHDVERLVAEVLLEPLHHALDGEVALVLVPLVLADVGGDVGHRVVGGVERVDLLEFELAAVGERHRGVHLAALEQLLEDAEGRWPRAEADRGAGLGERLGDREAEAAVVGDTGHEGALAAKVDREHPGSLTC